MNEERKFSEAEARDIGQRIGIDWNTSRFDVEQFRMGLAVELEHGRQDPDTNVSDVSKFAGWPLAHEFT